jgi:hypothetical protein
VQFARSTKDGYPYAIKFYVSRNAFEAEKKLYQCVSHSLFDVHRPASADAVCTAP